jgi:hypothetical protein
MGRRCMRDKELCLEVLRQIEEAATKVIVRFEPIHQVSDFTGSPAGVEKMDAICMMLIGKKLKGCEILSPITMPTYMLKRSFSPARGRDPNFRILSGNNKRFGVMS